MWSWDFVEDQTENGSRFRILTLIDEHTRESLAIHGAWSIRAVDVIMVLEGAIARYGAPEHLRSDNGPEFIAYAIVEWLAQQKIKTIYITPGSPWENGHIESFWRAILAAIQFGSRQLLAEIYADEETMEENMRGRILNRKGRNAKARKRAEFTTDRFRERVQSLVREGRTAIVRGFRLRVIAIADVR